MTAVLPSLLSTLLLHSSTPGAWVSSVVQCLPVICMALGSICGTTFKKKENDFYDYRAHCKVQNNLHIGLFRLTSTAKSFLWLLAQYLAHCWCSVNVGLINSFCFKIFFAWLFFASGSHFVALMSLELTVILPEPLPLSAEIKSMDQHALAVVLRQDLTACKAGLELTLQTRLALNS